jgi:DNA-binding response OmpR family regulator
VNVPQGVESIWVLDGDKDCVSLYEETLGLRFSLRIYDSVPDFKDALQACVSDGPPRLLLTDPEAVKGSLVSAFDLSKNKTASRLQIPEFIIASKVDDLDLMRFYLSVGARDYLLKPLSPNELVAKVERAFSQVSQREVHILRDEFDGIQIKGLTLREHQLVTVFLNRPSRSISREDLHDALWNRVLVGRKVLDVHLFNLRRKLRPHGYDIVYKDRLFTLCLMPK